MKLQRLYKIAASNNIEVESCGTKSLCLSDEGYEYILLDNTLSEREERRDLARELAHLHFCLTYTLGSLSTELGRLNAYQKESRAHSYAAAMIVELDDLLAAIDNGDQELWELAETLDTDEETIITAINFYKRKMML